MTKLERLVAKMHAEEEAKTVKTPASKPEKPAKPRVKPKVAKPIAPAFNPPMTMKEMVESLTPAEAANPRNVAMTISLALLDQLLRSSRPTLSMLSDNALSNLAYITSQAFEEKPNLSQVCSRAVGVADAIEFRTNGDEGEGIRALHEVERALVAQKMKGGK